MISASYQRRLLLLVLVLLLAGCYERQLSGTEIEALLRDAKVTGRHKVEGYDFLRRYTADGSFEQEPTGRYPKRTGTWSVEGDRIVIRWAGGRRLSRVMLTDDAGAYWKEVPGKGKVVVEYASFLGPDEEDRRKFLGSGERLRRWLLSWRGLLLAMALVALWLAIRGSKDEPWSLRNRIRKHLGPLRVGDRSYRHSQLSGLPPQELDAFARSCAEKRCYVELAWVFQVMHEQSASVVETWRRVWRAVEEERDADLQAALETALPGSKQGFRLETGDYGVLKALEGHPRAAYMFGRAFQRRAERATSAAEFDSNKAQGLVFYSALRDRKSKGDKDDEEDARHVKLAIEAYESLMYKNYIPPKPKGRSRSRSSGYVGAA